MNSWREVAERITEEFMAWGCSFSRKNLPEIAMSYECTPLFFWNWMDGEAEKSEKSFLRVLGYAWKKFFDEEDEPAPRYTAAKAEPVERYIPGLLEEAAA